MVGQRMTFWLRIRTPRAKIFRQFGRLDVVRPRPQRIASNQKMGVDMSELLFMVEAAPAGGYIARAFGVDIFTEGDDLTSLHANVRHAVRCHFDDGQASKMIRLHFTHEEVITA